MREIKEVKSSSDMTMHSFVAAAVFWIFSTTLRAEAAWHCSECQISYELVGCYKDNGHRPLPTEILNERDPSRNIYGGRSIDWMNWDTYMAGFACRCAAKAKERGWSVFGLQFYGECWSGPKAESYKAVGKSDKCIGNGYKKCGAFDRHCVGEQYTNMVYRIVSECDVKFERIGCNNDPHSEPRPLSDYILTDRDAAHKVSSGRSIDWRNWDAYIPHLACRCAKKAKERGDNTFGLQYYGECWSGAKAAHTYNNKGPSANCVNQCFEPCKHYNKFCIGKQFTNFVYKLSDAPCEIPLKKIGCFKEDLSNRALDKEILDQVNPPSPVFNGHYLDYANWNEEFPKMLCRCARVAKEGGFTMFGVHNHGSCWSGSKAEERYKKHGEANQCFKRFNSSCTEGKLNCAGGPSTQFVYKIESAAAGSGSIRRHYIPHPRHNYKKDTKAYTTNGKSHNYKTQTSKREMSDTLGLEDILEGTMEA